MADESGNQNLGVRHETGAATAAGLDGGIDRDQTEREPASGVQDDKETKTSSGAGGTSINANTAETYGAGDPENFTGGSVTSSGAAGGTGRGADTGHGITDASETDPMSSGASRTAEVDSEED
jgi:hypothetical protein